MSGGFAIAGFVLSIIGIVLPWMPIVMGLIRWCSPIPGFYEIPGIVIPGIVFSSIGIAKARKGFGSKRLAIAGLILGIIAIASVILAALVVIVLAAQDMTPFQNMSSVY